MGSLFQSEKSLSEIEEEKEQVGAEVSLLRQKVLKKQLESKLGKGSLKYFKGEDGKPMWSKVWQWLKTH